MFSSLQSVRMEIFHVYPKRRGDFGRQCLFSDRQAELLVDILPDPSLGLRFREQSPRERALQAGWNLSEHDVSLTFFHCNSVPKVVFALCSCFFCLHTAVVYFIELL